MNEEKQRIRYNGEELDEFTSAYVAAMLWSTTIGEDGETLEENHDADDIDPAAMVRIKADCLKFRTEQAAQIGDRLSNAGHDFWLTRNGHGCGYWDGDWEEPAATILDKAAQKFGEQYLEVGDDGKIYFIS